ncbi:hypothetical protein [Streptomyces sp. SID4982]|uniref:hypothetical protein n=1 Tax=Streptomyces sp. SID4982 TaxID=2690291 RepID=UPI00136A4BCB|nr:hypothetical protein [Streptomyces sp. SID4982]MYS17861.1 hypothetical protein [Streptomyces sp. SID4982]
MMETGGTEPGDSTAMHAHAEGNARVYQVGQGNIHIGTDFIRTVASELSSTSVTAAAARLAEMPLDQAVAACVAMEVDAAAMRLGFVSPVRTGEILAAMDEVRAVMLLASMPDSSAVASLCTMPTDNARHLMSVMPDEIMAKMLAAGRADVLPLVPPNTAAQMIGHNPPDALARTISSLPREAGLPLLGALPQYKQKDILRQMSDGWLISALGDSPPYVVAQLVVDLGIDRAASVVSALPQRHEVFQALAPYDAIVLLRKLGPEGSRSLLSALPADQAAYAILKILQAHSWAASDLGGLLVGFTDEALPGLLARLDTPTRQRVLEERSAAAQVGSFVGMPFDRICAEIEAMPKGRAHSAANHMSAAQVMSVLGHLSPGRARALAFARSDKESVCLAIPEKTMRLLVCGANPVDVYLLLRDAEPPRKEQILQRLPIAWRALYWSWMRGVLAASVPVLRLFG